MRQVISGWMVFSLAFSPSLINLGLIAKTLILTLGTLALIHSVSENHTTRPTAPLLILVSFVLYYAYSSLRLPAMVDLVALSLAFILLNLSYDLTLSKRVLTVSLSMVVSLVASLIYLQIEQVFFYGLAFPVDLLDIPPGIFILEGVVLGLVFAIAYLLSKKVSLIDLSLKRDYILSGCFIVFIVLSRVLASYTEGAGENLRFAVQANMTLILVGVLVLLWFFGELRKQENLNRSLALADQALTQYLDLYMQENVQLQKIRHDRQKELDILQHLLRNHQIEEAKTFLGSLSTAKKAGHGSRAWTKNAYVDAVIEIKRGEAQAQDISFDLHIAANLSSTHHDLALLTYNLLDNAFAAAGHTEEKRISLDMMTESQILYIKIENSSPPGALEAIHRGKGMGLKIAREILQKYKGELTISLQEKKLIRLEALLFLDGQ